MIVINDNNNNNNNVIIIIIFTIIIIVIFIIIIISIIIIIIGYVMLWIVATMLSRKVTEVWCGSLAWRLPASSHFTGFTYGQYGCLTLRLFFPFSFQYTDQFTHCFPTIIIISSSSNSSNSSSNVSYLYLYIHC